MLIVVEVRYDPALRALVLSQEDQSRITLAGPEDRVQWLVTGCPNDCYPEVRFLAENLQNSALGPFHGLRASASYVLSDGVLGEAGTVFPYVLEVKRIIGSGSPPSETVAMLDGLEVVQGSPFTSGGLAVTVSPEGEKGLKVEPQRVRIYSGGTVTWSFEGLAQTAAWIPQVEFFAAPQASYQQNPRSGPFTALCARGDQVVGSGNNGVQGEFGYVVSLLDAVTGGTLRSKIKDPGMANEGDPPGGAGP